MDRRGMTRGPANNPIPPRWLHCPRKANTLIGGKFLAFKTPLGPHYDDQVPEECRFPPSMLLASMSSYKVKLGLWIDLTFTNRFYDKADIEATGVKHVKLQCRGHGECPSEDQTKTFIAICSKFISQNPNEVIGIHCTHGFNRSGFLIIAYLVENLNWSLEAALKAFAQARSPGIYKEDYIKELHLRFGESEDAGTSIVCPPLPDWCTECDDSVDDDGNSVGGGGGFPGNKISEHTNQRRRKEFNKKNPTFVDGVEGVVSVTMQPKLVQIQRKCQNMCGWESSGFPGCQPVSMDNKNLHMLHDAQYKVSWKADGTRYLMLIDGEDQVYFIDRDNCVFQVSNLRFPRRKSPFEHVADTLMDGEMVIDQVDFKPVPRYLVYDIIRFEGQEVGKTDFDRRMLCIGKEIVGPRALAIQEGRLDRSTEPFSVRIKQFFDVTQTRELLSDKFTKQLSHDIDGLIFQPALDAYLPGRCMSVLKWKPASLNSVDFKLKICKEQLQGMMPETKGYLYVGKLDTPFAEIKYNKELKKLDKKIIECKYDGRQWKFMRERTDKSFPNSFDTAVAVCNSISHPVTKEKLIGFIDNYRWRPPTVKRPADGFPQGQEPHLKKLAA